MNAYIIDYPLTYLDWFELTQKTKEIITEYIDTNDIHSILNVTFKELFIAVIIEMNKLSLDLQIEIQKRLKAYPILIWCILYIFTYKLIIFYMFLILNYL